MSNEKINRFGFGDSFSKRENGRGFLKQKSDRAE
jgi:hypothetical protein